MKTFFIIIFSVTSFCFFSNKETHSSTAENIVIRLDALDKNNIEFIKNDLDNIYGVKSCRVSLESKSIFIQYNDSLFSFSNLFNLLDKWNLTLI